MNIEFSLFQNFGFDYRFFYNSSTSLTQKQAIERYQKLDPTLSKIMKVFQTPINLLSLLITN